MYYNLSKNIYRFAAGPSEGSFAAVRRRFCAWMTDVR